MFLGVGVVNDEAKKVRRGGALRSFKSDQTGGIATPSFADFVQIKFDRAFNNSRFLVDGYGRQVTLPALMAGGHVTPTNQGEQQAVDRKLIESLQ
jgi:hypothetical protein